MYNISFGKHKARSYGSGSEIEEESDDDTNFREEVNKYLRPAD